ncbi:MAG: Hsp70 family protein [Lachnospiraceae bacterium]|nr:Hsp70 family protein [Lachnospiraceae bacterium]
MSIGYYLKKHYNEPTAAAISYGVSGGQKKETVLVYDLGGGTFDITVMNIAGTEISVICTGGDDQLGGKDWDEALMNYVMERYEEEYEEDLSEDPEIVAALYVDVETWKKALTARESVKISVNGPAGRFREELTREKYEEITSHLLDRTKNLLDDVLRVAEKQGYPIDKIDKVLLVGGSSKMPQVATMIERDYGVIPSLQDPDEAVAKGAAIYAGNQKQFSDFVLEEASRVGKTVEEIMEDNLQSGNLDQKFMNASGGASNAIKISITNVLSRTYGIAALDDNNEMTIFNMLMVNDKLPASHKESFYTHSSNQQGVALDIYESRSTVIIDSAKKRVIEQGEDDLEGLPKKKMPLIISNIVFVVMVIVVQILLILL